MRKLVNSFLDLSRLEAGAMKPHYQPTDISQLTSDLVNLFKSTEERLGVELISDISPIGEQIMIDRYHVIIASEAIKGNVGKHSSKSIV
jgi:signal transduction histidine kinase